MSITTLFRKAFGSKSRAAQRFKHRRLRGFRRPLFMESLEERRLLVANVAVLDTGDDAAFAAIAAQLNDNTYGLDLIATVVQPSQIDTVNELLAFDVVVLGDDGTDPSPDTFTSVAFALNDWANNHDGGIVAVGLAHFGIRGEPEEAALDEIIPVDISGSSTGFEPAGRTLEINTNHPVSNLVNDITIAPGMSPLTNLSESVPVADSWGTVLGTFSDVSGFVGVVVGNVPTGPNPGSSVYLGPIYSGSSLLYDTTQWRSGDGDRLLEQAVHWAANVTGTRLAAAGYRHQYRFDGRARRHRHDHIG